MIDYTSKLISFILINEINLFELINKDNVYYIDNIVDKNDFQISKNDKYIILRNLIDNMTQK